MQYDTLVYLLEEGVYAIGFLSAGEMLCKYFVEGIEYEVSMEEWQYEIVADLV